MGIIDFDVDVDDDDDDDDCRCGVIVCFASSWMDAPSPASSSRQGVVDGFDAADASRREDSIVMPAFVFMIDAGIDGPDPMQMQLQSAIQTISRPRNASI